MPEVYLGAVRYNHKSHKLKYQKDWLLDRGLHIARLNRG